MKTDPNFFRLRRADPTPVNKEYLAGVSALFRRSIRVCAEEEQLTPMRSLREPDLVTLIQYFF